MDTKLLFPDPDERPLDALAPEGGYCSIFRTICCIGVFRRANSRYTRTTETADITIFTSSPGGSIWRAERARRSIIFRAAD